LGAGEAAPLKSLNFSISSFLSQRIATTYPRATSLAPSGNISLAMYPSSCISKSTVALSVSMEARISPGLTLSPSFFNHLAIFPCKN
jgi:hypothetical protein